MAVNKVIYDGNTLVDLTGDTVTATDLADGVKATGADGNPIVGLMQKVTIDAELSTTSTNPVQNKVIKAALDGKINKTDKIYEANLEWGGRDIAGGYSPIDGAMISNLGANRFAFGKVEGITVEYSEDAGETWVEYPLTDTAKVRLFSVGGNYLYAGGEKSRTPSVNDMIRVTIDSDAFGTYTALNKFAIEISTGGNRGCYHPQRHLRCLRIKYRLKVGVDTTSLIRKVLKLMATNRQGSMVLLDLRSVALRLTPPTKD